MRKLDIFMVGFASAFTGIAGSLVVFGGTLEQFFATPLSNPSQQTEVDYFKGFKKDRDALASDWGKIGGDFRRAIDQYVKTHEGKTNPAH